jgi:hypothetical protein
MCLGLDPEAGESPKILFDDAGDGSRARTANQGFLAVSQHAFEKKV